MKTFLTSLGLLFLGACAQMQAVDASVYGMPPEDLRSDLTVLVDFDDPVATSTACSQRKFGMIGLIVPAHGCVHAEPHEPIRMRRATYGPERGTTKVVEFLEPERAAFKCAFFAGEALFGAHWPDGACAYTRSTETHTRIIWPNPCDTGDLFGCHELGHAHQLAKGWIGATLTPSRHWGHAPPSDAPIYLASTTQERPVDRDPVRSGDAPRLATGNVSISEAVIADLIEEVTPKSGPVEAPVRVASLPDPIIDLVIDPASTLGQAKKQERSGRKMKHQSPDSWQSAPLELIQVATFSNQGGTYEFSGISSAAWYARLR